MAGRWVLVGVVALTIAARASAADPAPALSAQLRGFVLDFMPDQLFEDAKKWGTEKKNGSGKLKNDGRWIKYKITGKDLREKMELKIENLRKEGSKSTFDVKIAFDAQVDLERQTWMMGHRLYSGSTRAKFRIFLALGCELTPRVE